MGTVPELLFVVFLWQSFSLLVSLPQILHGKIVHGLVRGLPFSRYCASEFPRLFAIRHGVLVLFLSRLLLNL